MTIDEVLTYAYRPVGEGVYEVTVKIDGRITAISTVALADAKTMITETRGKGPADRMSSLAPCTRSSNPGRAGVVASGSSRKNLMARLHPVYRGG